MEEAMTENEEPQVITIQVVYYKETGLLVAFSDDLKGLYVHARSEEELRERIPVAIRDILQADGHEVDNVSELVRPEVDAGFVPALRKYEASFGSRAAA
jgi:Domain of unknown function (DUF1902)